MMSRTTGKRITQREHVSQSIADILCTPIGTRVERRDYGSVLPMLVDQPLNQATMLRLIAASIVAIRRWEPRERIRNVRFFSDRAGQLVLEADRDVAGAPDTIRVPTSLRVAA